VYDPHLAPKFERWAEQYVARLRARRRMKEGAVAVPIHVDLPVDGKSTGKGSKGSISKRSEEGSDDSDDERSSMELEQLVEKEVKEWRSQVDQSQAKSPLRHRKNVSAPAGLALDEVRLSAFTSSTQVPLTRYCVLSV
jgi:hypothetical protein